jgi:hypothetical protein
MDEFREDEDEFEEDEFEEGDDSDDEPTVPCPSCRRMILEDSPRCPHCERYISAEDHAAPAKPLWVVVTALILLGMAVWWAVAGL